MIKPLDLHRFKNDAFSGYCARVVALIKDRIPQEDIGMAASFFAAYEDYTEALRKTEDFYGNRILEADASADHTWRVMNAQIHLLIEHPTDAVRTAAETLKAIFDKYDNPTRRPYTEEYSILENLLKDLTALDTTVLQTTLLDAWCIKLRNDVDQFNQLMKLKTQNKGSVDLGSVQRLRSTLESTCRDLLTRLNAMLLLHPSPALTALENDLNALNDTQRVINKAKRTSKANATAKAESSLDLS